MTNLAKIALVTGASRGIGQAIAITLGKRGFYVIATATSVVGVENIKKNFAENQINGEAAILDVNVQTSIDDLMNNLTASNNLPQILVNNAAITRDNLLLRMEDEEWQEVIETNLNAIYRMTKACLKPMFRARFGRVINISSVVAYSGNSGQTNYSAAKAGIIGFTKSLAQEMGSRGITANVVAPGFIDTDMTRTLPNLVKEELLKRIPAKRLGKVEDVAAAVAFLASEEAAYINGETIHVNGGMYMA